MLSLHPTNVKSPLGFGHQSQIEKAERSRRLATRMAEKEYWQYFQYGVLDQSWNRLNESCIEKLHSADERELHRARGYYDGINWQHAELQLGLPEDIADSLLESFLRRAA